MNPLAEATEGRRPFSNGTEEQAWMGVWCSHCVHDHGMTHHDGCGDGCPILLDYIVGTTPDVEWRWPEVWLPAPPGSFALPSRMVCGKYEPCTEGECKGDPHAEVRSAITAEVTAAWQDLSGQRSAPSDRTSTANASDPEETR